MTKIILFNGPPRSGKDTATRMALEALKEEGVHYRFASPLKDAVHALFGMPLIVEEHFDKVKDEPCAAMLGMTPREAYIWLAESAVRPKFGKDFFARVAAKCIKDNIRHDCDKAVVSDCGFQIEADTMVDEFGKENVLTIQMHRKGSNFDNDSRAWVVTPFVTYIENNGTLAELRNNVCKIVKRFTHGV